MSAKHPGVAELGRLVATLEAGQRLSEASDHPAALRLISERQPDGIAMS